MAITHRSNGKHYNACSSTRRKREYNIPSDCTNRSIQAEVLDEQVWQTLQELVHRPDRIKKLIQADQPKKNHQKTIQRLQNSESDLIKKRDSVMKWFRTNIISVADAEKQLTDINAALNEIASRLQEIAAYSQTDPIEKRIENF